jgi:hypothetical protein
LNATANYRSGDDTEPYDEETWDLIMVYLEGVAEADKKNSGNQQSKKKDVQVAKEKRERAAEGWSLAVNSPSWSEDKHYG